MGAKDEVSIYREDKLLANAFGEVISFNGLPSGIYTIKYGSMVKGISLFQDQAPDLAENSRPNPGPAVGWPALGELRMIIGVAAILVINLTDVFLILRIARRG